MGERVEHPSYIVLEIPEPMATKIRRCRRLFDKTRAALPAEITLTGSSGLGLLAKGQDWKTVFGKVDEIAARFAPFEACFSTRVEYFTSTDTYFLSFRNPDPFERLHKAFAASGLAFEKCRYPFRPHCTIKLHKKPDDEEVFDLFFLKPPRASFEIDTMAVYELPTPLTPRLLHKARLSAGAPGSSARPS